MSCAHMPKNTFSWKRFGGTKSHLNDVVRSHNSHANAQNYVFMKAFRRHESRLNDVVRSHSRHVHAQKYIFFMKEWQTETTIFQAYIYTNIHIHKQTYTQIRKRLACCMWHTRSNGGEKIKRRNKYNQLCLTIPTWARTQKCGETSLEKMIKILHNRFHLKHPISHNASNYIHTFTLDTYMRKICTSSIDNRHISRRQVGAWRDT